eukprot:gnl/TRDRNA2_/TRDRNA2_166765_c0_seq3.p1 gnl/TRDRNA2_/TRDRNA2_166765_c0~~gnl/TRDRNA2_/TRDRNA2_166765_c0_seq3.p1  ORF type:complete len:455 (+),score=100.29 gnl/TRDRNA2_/TRDRNA2_166765_c0_seq3:59-1423(+)
MVHAMFETRMFRWGLHGKSCLVAFSFIAKAFAEGASEADALHFKDATANEKDTLLGKTSHAMIKTFSPTSHFMLPRGTTPARAVASRELVKVGPQSKRQAFSRWNCMKPTRQDSHRVRACLPAGPTGPIVFAGADRIASDAFTPESYKLAFLFPGQGVQSVGMAVDLVEQVPKAKELFDKASEILGYDLLAVCRDGPQERLNHAAVSQPAVFVTSMAAVEKLKMEKGEGIVNDATVTMGLSLGEYTALCFAGAISFEDGVRLTQEGGAAMDAAADLVDSSMASVIGLDSEKVVELCKAAAEKSGKHVQIANYLCKGNYAVSGAKEAIDAVTQLAQPKFNAKLVVPLAVAGAFHTDFMRPGIDRLRAILRKTDIKEPRIPVVSNVDGKAHKDPEVIKEILTLHLTSPVLWEDSMAAMMAADFESAYELGPGKVLSGILRRFDKDAKITNIGAAAR